MFTILHRALPAIRIHSWGGFGSQLFTLHFALRLMAKFPHRRIRVVNHSSGVTKRYTELDWAGFDITFHNVDDFRLKSEKKKEMHVATFAQKLKVRVKCCFVIFLRKLSILEYANDEVSFERIKFWTFMVRGHYTGINLDSACIESIYEFLVNPGIRENPNKRDLIIHYRLGDLLKIDQKSPTPYKRVEDLIRNLGVHEEKTTLLTDSPPIEFAHFTRESKILRTLKPVTLTPVDTISACISADNFVGTGAKLSLWSAIFRQYILKKQSFLPRELEWAKKIGLDLISY